MSGNLLCFARGRPGEWEAICLDYDIAVQGRSFEEIERLLAISIDDYIESARQEAPEVRDRLLRRAAPIHVWLSYAIAFLWHNCCGRQRKTGDRLEHSFQMPCPA
jgi:predicted NBD/HSP70 family sugar kinase